tara:strand:+ start:40 stop:768 length:729 start_codon:yes stop_codon:yes gene_type:complete
MLNLENFNKFIIGNWKLNGSLEFVEKYINDIRFNSIKNPDKCVVICPPFPFIDKIKSNNLLKGAQDCSVYDEGSYTGEISTKILKDIGCSFCIIGHSERRNYFNENDEVISKKILNCIEENIIPVLCVGETLNEKNNKQTKDILNKQIEKNLTKNLNAKNIIIAYEPIWAIGTGMTPDPKEISEIHCFIKEKILSSSKYKIIYGGSVSSSNCQEIVNHENIDGVLVGGASLNVQEFNKIIES